MPAYLPGHERRRVILDGAKKVFAQRGYHDTNISHICDDLGIARGTLYLYFKSKKEVFSAIIEELLERLRAAVAAEPPVVVSKRAKPTREQVVLYAAAGLERCLQAVFADEASLRILLREAIGLDVHIDAILRAIDDIVIDRCTADLTAAQRAGVLRHDVDPRTAALFMLGGIQKLALGALADKSGGIDISALALEATKMNLLGLIAEEVRT